MKRQRGFGLIEVLIALAILIAITAMIGVNLQQVVQATNERNASAGVLTLMTAEANYMASFPSAGYVTGANLHYLSDCPAPVTQNGKTTVTPTATAACQSISLAYTNNKTAYQYNFAVTSTPGPDGVAGTSDDGYLISATPVNKPSGRFTYCANNQDGLLRGLVEGVTPTTAAACDAFNVIAAGTASAPAPAPSNPTTYSKTFPFNPGGSSTQTVTVGPLMLPAAGTYLIHATSTVVAANSNSDYVCFLNDSNGSLPAVSPVNAYTTANGTLAATGVQNASATPIPLSAVTTSTSTNDAVYVTCTLTPSINNKNWEGNGQFPSYANGNNAQFGVGPTTMTAILVTNNPE